MQIKSVIFKMFRVQSVMVFVLWLNFIQAIPFQSESFCSGRSDGNYPDADNCYGYIACSSHFTYNMPCPANLKWNDHKKRCDWSENAYPDCGNVVTTTQNYPSTSPKTTPSTSPSSPSTTTTRHASTTSTPSTSPTTSSTTSSTTSPSSECQVGKSVKDRCDQLCICSSSRTLVRCTRIRKEFTSMTAAERQRYVSAVRKVSTDPSFQSRYNNLITLHREIFIGFRIHQKEHFLTWHRWYVLQYENLLRQVDCKVTVPYWDWTVVSGSPWGTTERDVWYSGNSGLGGNGVNPTYCVKDGPFRDGIWKLPPSDFLFSRCLRRNFTGHPPDAVALSILLNTPASLFHEFELTLRTTFHDTVHCLINGTMCSFDSSGAPEFFFHHAMVDKIWTDWQKKGNAHKEAYFKQFNQSLPSTNGLRPVHLIDNQALPGGVRVLYAEINNPLMKRTIKGLRSASPEILVRIPRRRFSGISERTIKLFRMSKKEAAKAKRLEKKYQVDNEHLKHVGRKEPVIEEKLGFDYHIVHNKDTYCKGKPNGNYPSPKTCQGYIACSNSFTYHMPCPANLYWNDAQKRCDWPRLANPGCHGMTTSIPFTPPRNFCTGKVDGDYPNPNDCYGFITCSNGLKYKKYCPALLMWNDVKKQCDWPSQASSPCQV